MSVEQPAVLALGSNLGNRLAMLQVALDRLADTPGIEVTAVSRVYETEPVGGPEQPDYLNAVVLVRTSLSAEALLDRALAIETELGRERRERWGPRTVDVDLVMVGQETRDQESLTLPHPRAHERMFVLAPWADADPQAVLPGRGPVRHLLDALAGEGPAVRPRPDLALTVPR